MQTCRTKEKVMECSSVKRWRRRRKNKEMSQQLVQGVDKKIRLDLVVSN